MGDVPEMTGSTESEFVPRMLGSQWKSFGLTYAYVCAYSWNMDMDICTHDIEVVKSSREGQTRKVIEFKMLNVTVPKLYLIVVQSLSRV